MLKKSRTSNGLPQREAHWKPMIKQQICIRSPRGRHFGAKPFVFFRDLIPRASNGLPQREDH